MKSEKLLSQQSSSLALREKVYLLVTVVNDPVRLASWQAKNGSITRTQNQISEEIAHHREQNYNCKFEGRFTLLSICYNVAFEQIIVEI
jgi:hypothetical protein